MKKKMWSLAILVLVAGGLSAQKKVTVEIQDDSINQNLDLKAVAIAFGESKTLEEFEEKLNDDDAKISNLDLNKDGEADYLRVIDRGENNVHNIVIQDVVGKDDFKDIATVRVEKNGDNKAVVEITGDRDMYGEGYVLQPEYLYVPAIFTVLWTPGYVRWSSPYYWEHYPSRFHHRPILAPRAYRTHIVYHYSNRTHHTYRSYSSGGGRVVISSSYSRSSHSPARSSSSHSRGRR